MFGLSGPVCADSDAATSETPLTVSKRGMQQYFRETP